jgi:drug/metabolite transporter (DMT)-like permease
MRLTSGFRKLIPSILAGAVGIFLIIYGGNDDSPGAQLLGLVIFIASMIIMVKTRRKISCDIKK